MNHKKPQLSLTGILRSITGFGQTNRVMNLFPERTILHGNIPYQNNTLKNYLLDIYLPVNFATKVALMVFIHGGGGPGINKYADIGYMKKTVWTIRESGYPLASIDYRFLPKAVSSLRLVFQ